MKKVSKKAEEAAKKDAQLDLADLVVIGWVVLACLCWLAVVFGFADHQAAREALERGGWLWLIIVLMLVISGVIQATQLLRARR